MISLLEKFISFYSYFIPCRDLMHFNFLLMQLFFFRFPFFYLLASLQAVPRSRFRLFFPRLASPRQFISLSIVPHSANPLNSAPHPLLRSLSLSFFQFISFPSDFTSILILICARREIVCHFFLHMLQLNVHSRCLPLSLSPFPFASNNLLDNSRSSHVTH